MQKLEHNVETNEVFLLDLTTEEIANLNELSKKHEERLESYRQTIIEKSNQKIALLNRLGITEEEAKLLLS